MHPRDVTSLRESLAAALMPPPHVSVSEWAPAYRVLDSRTSSQPGRWRNDRTPYLVEIMECLSPHHPAKKVTIMKSARVGGTEAINNMIGTFAHLSPCPIMIVQPTLDDTREWMKDQLDPMIELTPELNERFARLKSRGKSNTILHKKFRGGMVFGVGANTPSGFRRRTARVVACDEVDGWPASVGEEGDPVTLAETRATTYPHNKKVVLVSTPTVKGRSRIEKSFLEGDQRYYHVPCPHCGALQRLVWAQVEAPKDEPGVAYYRCVHCEERIEERHKRWMLDPERAEWVAANPAGTHPSFHLSALYSLWMTWASLAAQWFEAQGDPPRVRVVVNTLFGETWEDDHNELDGESLLARRERWWEGEDIVLPRGANMVTAGVDTQDDRFEVAVWAWGAKRECWLIDYAVVWGDPSEDQTLADLDAVLSRTYQHELYASPLAIEAVCIDSAGHKTQDVYRYAKPRARWKRWPTVGRAGEGRPIWPREGRIQKSPKVGRINLFTVGVDAAKTWWYSMMKLTDPAVKVHFPLADFCDIAFFNELTVERRRSWYKRGHEVVYWWKPDGARNEALDTSVLALAALAALESQGRDPGKPRTGPHRAPAVPVAPKRTGFTDDGPAPRRSPSPRRGKKWLS